MKIKISLIKFREQIESSKIIEFINFKDTFKLTNYQSTSAVLVQTVLYSTT